VNLCDLFLCETINYTESHGVATKNHRVETKNQIGLKQTLFFLIQINLWIVHNWCLSIKINILAVKQTEFLVYFFFGILEMIKEKNFIVKLEGSVGYTFHGEKF
jgi:hypothetical protein